MRIFHFNFNPDNDQKQVTLTGSNWTFSELLCQAQEHPSDRVIGREMLRTRRSFCRTGNLHTSGNMIILFSNVRFRTMSSAGPSHRPDHLSHRILKPADFWLCGFLKSKVYSCLPDHISETLRMHTAQDSAAVFWPTVLCSLPRPYTDGDGIKST